MQIEAGKNLESQLTNFIKMSQFFIEPLYNQPHEPEIVLGVVEDLLQHICKYSLILKAAGYKIDALLNLSSTREV